eukprot:g21939.t1
MDTGYINLLDDDTRIEVLRRTREILGGGPFVAGAFVADRSGAPFNADEYRRKTDEIAEHGGTPVIFQSFGLVEQQPAEVVAAYEKIAVSCDQFIGFELTTDLAPFGAVYDLETYEALMGIPQCVGAKHSSFHRVPEWERLVLRDRVRPEFVVYTGNDFAIDMVMYGSDYLLGLSTFAPDLFARRDALWEAGDPGFYELNDQLQDLGSFAFRTPGPAYKHSAAQFLKLRGWIACDETHQRNARRPESDIDVLREFGRRMGVVEANRQESKAAEQHRFFESEVAPLLKKHCLKCHSGPKAKGHLRLDSRAGVLKGGDTGAAISLKAPEKSLLLDAVNYGTYEMPPTGKLSAKEIAVLTRWAKMGAPWSPKVRFAVKGHGEADKHAPPQVNEETKKFWSFQPVKRPAVPTVQNRNWVTNEIDAFVLSRLEKAGLQPAAPAGKTELLRRAYYDLTGLPPTPEEADAFLNDDSPQAFEKVVDRLLKSPHYGEKWGRHWLDLVRYAESNSYERDNPKPYVWRYRDYVIRSFNSDKPYSQFLREQIAGDELDTVTRDSIIATGYYRLGIWQDEPVDRVQALYDDLDDILLTTSQVFLGLTINCARCHDHKISPIPQKDYYRMLAFFSGLNRFGVRSEQSVKEFSLRPIATEAQKKRHAEAVKEHNRKISENNRSIKSIEKSAVEFLSNVEKQDFKFERNRVGILRKHVPNDISRQKVDLYASLLKLRRRLRRFQPSGMDMALCVTEIGTKPRETHVLIRGNPHAKGAKVEPGFPSVLSPPPPATVQPKPGWKTSGRRRALAEWLASDRNPLTARVIVNRIWQYHFGRGIVRSSNNFGFGGIKPTHPQLLDWLAAELVDGGWTMKRLHKMMMLSSTYRMSSQPTPAAAAGDAGNDLFSRFQMRRLTAEEIRDSILAVNGALNRKKMFGPSIYTIIPKEVLAGQSRPGAGWGRSSPEDRNRRSIYIHVKRSLLTPLLFAFDAADPDSTCPVRFETTQPTQALAMMNSDFIHREASVFAENLLKTAGTTPQTQVKAALRRVLQREPSKKEIARGTRLIAMLKSKHKLDDRTALKMFCLVALNLNEFLFVD